MVSSTCFLVESDKTSLLKVKRMIANNQVISLIMLVAMQGGDDIGVKEVVKQAFLFLFITLWYITCYVMYYCIHGFLNKALRSSDISPRIAMIVLFVYNGIIFIFDGVLYFTEALGFVLIYVFTWYIKKNTNERNVCDIKRVGNRVLFIGIIGWILGAVMLSISGVHVDFLGSRIQNWNRFYNPFILAIAYGSMLLVSYKEHYLKLTNMISCLSLYIYDYRK